MAHQCVLLLALAAGTVAGPLSYRENPTICASTCPESSKFSWQTGRTYEYQYESDVKTLIAGATEEHSSLHIRATALIEVLGPCEMALRLSDVSLQDSSPSQYESRQHVEQSWEFKRSLQERSLRFAFLDGRIESVCPEEGEETWVVNLKKGIISAFQNTQTRLDSGTLTVESDIAGTCPVEYEVEGYSWGTRTVKKSKDLLGCTERMGHFTAFQSTPYDVDSAIQSLPLMKSTHECRQQIKDGILTESSCVELHVFRPFSRGNNGAVTEVSYKLSLYKQNSGVSTRLAAVGKRSSLLFEHEINKEEMLTTSRQAQLAIDKLCRKSRDEITTDVPRLFKELVDQMRRLDQRTLQNFYRSASGSCDKAPKFLRDAIPVLGTPSSVTLIRDLVINGEVSETDGQIWLTSMAFIANPTREMLAQVKPLLTTSHNHRKSVLAISTMVRTYCRRQANCATEPEVSDIIRILEDNLRYNCKAQSDNEHDLILMSLKAIGNTGHAPQAVSTISRCIRNQELGAEIRVAALQAFRRMSCDIDMSNIQDILANSVEDSEIRIQAYLALMHCPSERTLRYVSQLLANEEVNQVGSFIWTHLTNLMETSSPHKQDIRTIMENVSLKKKFDVDKRKYSRNVEWSAFSQLLNVGGMAEGNLIWSEKSFVPRSAAINLTVDMFGESVNVLEIGGRVQGLEKTLEKLFSEQDNTVDRRKRATDEIAAMDRRFGLKRDGTQASYYIRVFGNEIRYDDFHDFDLDTIKDKLNYLNWLIELSKEHNFEVTKTMLFLDANLIVPTAAGLPLKLTVDGTSSVSVSVSGKLDIRQMFSSLSTFDIDGTVKPSASMEITGEMGIDAHVARTGIKMKTTLHTSTVAQGKIQMKDGRIFNLDIKPPQDNTQVISAENKFFILYRDSEREQQMLSAKRIERSACTSPRFGTITGLEVCGQLSLPWSEDQKNVPWFVFWGPASAKVVLNKKDSHDSYVMEVKYVKEKARKNGAMAITDKARIYMDTPGSRINRKILAEFTADRADKQVNFNLDTPWKKAALQGGLTNTDELKKFFATATLDGRSVYSFNAEVAIDKRSYSSQYTPKLEIIVPGRERILLNGDVKHRPGKKGVFSFVLKNVFDQPIKTSGSIITINEDRQMRYETDLSFSSQILNGKLAGFIDNSKEQTNSVSSKLDMEFTYKDQPQHSIKFEEQFTDGSSSKTYSYKLDSSWSTTLLPRYNGEAHFDYFKNDESLTANLNSGLGDNRITFSDTWKFRSDIQDHEIDARLQIPVKNIDYGAKLEYLFKSDELKASGSAKYCRDKEASFELTSKLYSKKPLNFMGEAKLTYPGRDMSVSGSVEERAANVYHQDLNIQLQKYENIQVTSVYKMGDRHELTSDITIPDTPKISIKGHLKPDLKNLQAHGEVSYNGKTYLTDANWTHRGTMSNFNTEANVEVAYPERRVTVRGSARRDGSEITSNVETKWDANRDEAKKFVMSSSVNIERMTPGLDLQLSFYPRQFVNLKANGKYETRGWYKSDSDVEGSLSLQSSFENFEDISAAFVHDRTPKLYKTSGEVSWKRGQKIVGVLNLKKRQSSWSNAEVEAQLTTPFRGARKINADLTYNLQDKTFSTNAKARLEDKQMTVSFDGELNIPQHKVSGEISFTSPFQGFEALTASLRHNDNGQRYQSNVAASWAPSKQITAAFTMQHQGNMAAAVNNGELVVSTPFRGYQQTKASWQHEHNANKLTNLAQIEQEGKAIYNHKAVANMKKTNKKYLADLQASMKTQNMDEISFTLDHSHDRQEMKAFRSDYSVSWKPSKTITLSYDIDMSRDTLLSVKAKFMSPFRGFESLALTSNTNNNGQTYTTANEFKWANNKKLTLSSDVTVRGYQLEMSGRLTTPFDGARTVVLNARNQKQDGIWVSHADLDYGKRIELDTELSTGWKKMVSLHLQSACPYARDVHFKSEVKGSLRDFHYSAEANHEKLASAITWSGIVKTSDVNKIKITSDLNTPFAEVRSLKTVLNYIREGDSIHVDGSIQHPKYRATISEDISYRLGRFFNTNTVVEYVEGKKIELNADFKFKPKIAAKVVWKSPFEKLEAIDLMLNHEGTLKSFSTAAELNYSPKDKIAADVDFTLRGTALSARASLVSPFRQAKRVVVDVNHEGSWTAFRNEASLQLNRKRASGKSEFNLDGNDVNLKAELVTPIQDYETMTLELVHHGPATDFNNNAVLTVGNQQLSASSVMRLRRSSLTGSVALQLPFRKLSRLNLDIEHSGAWSNFNNKVVVGYNNKKILSKTNFVHSGDSYDGKITVKTPYDQVRSLGAEIHHEGPATNFRNSATLSLNEKTITANGEFTLSGNNVFLKASAVLPFTEVSSVSVEFNHQGPANNFNNNAVITYNNKRITASSQFTRRGSRLSGKADFEMPEHKAAAEFSHSGGSTNFNNNAMFSYNDKRIDADSRMTLRGYNLEANANFASPWATVAGEIKHSGPASDFRNGISVTYNGDAYKGESQFSKSGNSLSGNVKVEYPSRKMSAEFNHRGKLTNFNNDMTLVYGDKKIEGGSKFRLNGNTMSTEASLNMPDNSMSVVASHEGPANNFKNNFNIQYNRKRIRGKTEYSRSGNSMALKASLSTPYRMVKSASIELNHDGPLTNFNNNAVLGYNNKQISGNSQFTLSGNRMNVKAELQAPETRLQGELNHNGKLTNFKNDATLTYNGQTLTGNSEFRWRGNDVSLKSELNTPSNRLSADISHSGTWSNFNNNGVLAYNSKKVTGNSMFSRNGDSLRGQATLSVGSKTFEIEMNHRGSASNFASDARVEYDGKQMTGNAEFSLNRNTLNAKAELNLPFRAVRHVAVEVSHSGPVDSFKNSAKVIIDDDSVTAGSEFDLEGNTLTAKANLRTTYGMEPVVFELGHSGPKTSFSNNILVSYGRRQLSGNSEFNMQGNSYNLKATIESTFPYVKPMSIDVRHQGPATSHTSRGSARYGRYEINVDHEFSLQRNTLHLQSAMRTNIGNVKPMSVELNHQGAATDFNNNVLLSYGDDNISGTSEFKLQGHTLHLKVTAQTTLGRVKPILIEINHSGPMDNFENSIAASYGNKEITSNLKFGIEGNTVTLDVKLQTPFKQLERLVAKINHNGKNWRNFENSGTVKVNNKKYTGQSEVRWFGKIFKLYAEVNVPDEYSIKINHKGSRTDFSNNLKIKIPGEKISGTSSFKKIDNSIEGRVNMDSTIRGFNNLDAAFTHEGNPNKFKSTFDLQTPFRNYKSFSGELNHEGTMDNFQTSGTLNLPFQKMRNVAVRANHQSGFNNFNTAASVSYDDKAISGAVNYKKTDMKVMADANLQTPYRGFENFGASMEHTGSRSNFQTNAAISTSIEGYERFAGKVSHRGDMNQFNTMAEVTTPIPKYNKFGFNVEHTGNRRNFKTSGSVTTSIPGYRRFAGSADYSYDGTKLRADGSIRTPFRGYEEFGLKADHTGMANGFRTSVEATSSIDGYEKFGASVEKKGSLNDFELTSGIQTPFRNYQNFATNLKYAGHPTNFRTSGHVETSIPGYERFSGSVNHNGNWRVFSTNAEVHTPIRGHEVYTMAIQHDGTDGIRTSGSVEYPGKKYGFSLNHRGTAKNFNTDFNIETPHRGYEQFGVTVDHSGDLSDMTQSGTIRLPLRSLPEIKYSVSHRGDLRDFTSSGSLEYNREKVEGSLNYKHTSSWDEDNYEGVLALTSTHGSLRDFRLTAKHTRSPHQKSGTLDVTYNGQKTVDLDYEYSMSGKKMVNLKVRQPRPFETKINLQAEGNRIVGDASLNWDNMFTASAQINVKNEPNDREIDLQLVLPSRTISLKSLYTMTETSLKHSTDLQWGNGAANKLSYDLQASRISRRGQTTYDARLSFRSKAVSGETTLTHVCVPGRQYTTELALLTDKRMAIKNDLAIDDSSYRHTLTVEHPEMRRGVTIKTEGSASNGAYDGKVEMQYNREVFTLTGRVADESTSSSAKYSGSFGVAHPNSGLDVQFSASVENDPEISSVFAESKYMMARDRQHRIVSLRAEINKLRKELNLEIITPVDSFHVYGQLASASNGVYHYTIEASCDHNTVRGELTVMMPKSVDMKIHYSDGDFLHATAKASPDQVKAEVYRMVSGNKIQEALFTLQKDAERLVSGRTYWRPAMYREIRAAVQDNDFKRQHMSNWDQFVNEVSDEYNTKADYIKRNMKPLSKALKSVRKDMVSTYESVKSDLSDMYANNEFYLKDIRSWFDKAADWARSAYDGVKRSTGENYTKAKAVVAQSRSSLDEITEHALAYTEDVSRRLSEFCDSFKWQDLMNNVKTKAKHVMNRVSNHPTVKDMLKKFRETGLWSPVHGDARAVAGTAPSLWNQVMSRDDVQAGISYLTKRMKNSEIANKYFEVKKTFDGIMDDIRQNGLKTVRANVMAWLKNYFQTDKDSFVFGDNDLRFSLYVPLPLDDLRSIPKVDINFSKYLRQAKNIYSNYLPKYDWTFWDYYYNYRPRSNIKDMIPPFKAHATLSGNQHYMTFDRRFYEFSGECSYLLARDFIDGTFSVIVNYERRDGRPAKKSVTVISNDKTVVISTDGRVMVDNSRVEMPLVIGGITIVRDENQIVVNKKNDLTVSCDLAHDQCTVEVSGWYYSKTGGLMGTYNNEQVDDFTTVDQQRLQNVGQFAASWSLGARCRPVNSAVEVNNEVDVQSTRYSICGRYFKDESSPFRRCFKVVDPEPFMKMCINDLAAAGQTPTEYDTCNIAAFYVSECEKAEVPVRIPSSCVRCEMENGHVFYEGQNVTISNDEVPSSADVVFVIHHHECNKMMLDNLKSIVDNLEKVFKAEQLTNNRYAILGYGGPDIMSSVHIHTMDGQVFATRDKILLGLENFHTTSGDWEDAMAAVKYATNLPFRVGVSKNILLLPCAPCRQGQATFSELQQLLLFRDINFHVLMQYNFLFKGNKNAGTAYIFGVDRETVYTRKDAGTTELVGDSEIRSQILMPKDLCVALTEETDGSVFNTLQYINSRPFIQKRFMDVLVRVIADKAEPSDCQICECRPDNVGAGKADCRHCVRPDPIYEFMPDYSELLPPPVLRVPEGTERADQITKVEKTAKKVKKTKVRKTKKQLNAKKRAMRERRLKRLEQQQS